MTAHKGQLSPPLRSWEILLLSGQPVTEAPETIRGDEINCEKTAVYAVREFME